MLRALVIILLALLPEAFAFSPKLERVEPRGGERGQEVRLELIGQRLFEPEELLFYREGIEVRAITKGRDHKKCLATIFIPKHAELGEYPFRLRGKEGLTEMKTFWVGQFPTVLEKRSKDGKRELNDSFDRPQKIRTNITVQGVSKREDSDYYQVFLTKGQRLSVEVEGMRLGRVMFDPYVEIISPEGEVIAVSDDSPHLGRDCAASALIPKDGNYRVLVRESALEGSSKAQYRLHVGHFPRATWVYPIAGKPGETKEFTFYGDPTGPIKETITLPEKGPFSYRPSHAGYQNPTGHEIRISSLNTVYESEPNSTKSQANPSTTLPVAFEGILSEKNDFDYFRFTAKKDQKLRAQIFAREYGSAVDTLIRIVPLGNGKALGSNDDAIKGTPDSRVDFTIPADGDYVVQVRDQLNRGDESFRYRLEISPKPISVHAALPTSDRNDDQKYKFIAVPRGAKLAIVPNIQRRNIKCELALVSPKLPSGISVKVPEIPTKLNSFPLLFTADEKAPLSGALLPFTLKDPKSAHSGPIREEIAHVKINNLGTYHSTSFDKIAVAVTEKAPFSIKLSIPPVPIVPGGIHPLKITVKRDKNFKAPIKISVPFKPPGITAPNEIEIPEDKNEITLNLNAKGDIKPGNWQICVTAKANTKRGEVRLSSDLHPLQISDRLIALTLEMATTAQGQNTAMVANLNTLQDYKGEATISLEALPHGVKATPQKITKDLKKISIPLTVSGEVRRGRHRNIFARVTVPSGEHHIIHQLGHGGVLRVNRPATTAKK